MKLGGLTLAAVLAFTMAIGGTSASAADTNATIDVGSLHEVLNLDNTANGGAGLTRHLMATCMKVCSNLTTTARLKTCWPLALR